MLSADTQNTICGDKNESDETAKERSIHTLLSELRDGYLSGEQGGWLDADDVFDGLKERYHHHGEA